MLNRRLPQDSEDDVFRWIMQILGPHLRPILYEAPPKDEMCEHAQYCSRILQERGDCYASWELLARWHMWLVFWGRLQEKLEDGDLDQLEDDEDVSAKDIGAAMEELAANCAPEPEELQNLLHLTRALLIDKATGLLEASWQGGHLTAIDQVECIAKEPWPEGCETMAVVYMDYVIWTKQQKDRSAALLRKPCRIITRTGEVNAAAPALARVALTAHGRCPLSLRVSRSVCAYPGVHERSQERLKERKAFKFMMYSGRRELVRGFRTTWPWLVANSREERGEGLKDAEYYKTVGPGPELFAVLGSDVYYNEKPKWQKYKSASMVEPFPLEIAWLHTVSYRTLSDSLSGGRVSHLLTALESALEF